MLMASTDIQEEQGKDEHLKGPKDRLMGAPADPIHKHYALVQGMVCKIHTRKEPAELIMVIPHHLVKDVTKACHDNEGCHLGFMKTVDWL